MLKLEQKFIRTIKKNRLVERGDSVLLAVSGGPDSTALFFLFNSIKKELDLRLVVAHFNHQIRGREADQDEKFVKELAQRKKCKFIQGAMQKPQAKLSENEARRMRYVFLLKTAKKQNTDWIALGHNANDQAETVILHFLRGAGIQGLRGMQYKQNKIIRPLLDCTKKEILNFLKRKKISFRIDSSNLKTTYKRNFIRLKLLPLIQKEINSGISKTLCRQAKVMQRLEKYIQQEIKVVWQRFKIKKTNQGIILNLKEVLLLNEFLQLEILKRAVLIVKKDLKDIYSYHLEEILQMIGSNRKQAEKKFKKILFLKNNDLLEIRAE